MTEMLGISDRPKRFLIVHVMTTDHRTHCGLWLEKVFESIDEMPLGEAAAYDFCFKCRAAAERYARADAEAS